MATIFGNTTGVRGCYTLQRQDTSESRGALLALPSGMRLPDTGFSDPFFVQSVNFQLAESRAISQNIGDANFIYAFGHDGSRSMMTVTLLSIMYGDGRATVSDLLQAYIANRLWEEEDPAYLVLEDSTVLTGFLEAITSSTANPQTNTQSVTYRMAILKLPERGS